MVLNLVKEIFSEDGDHILLKGVSLLREQSSMNPVEVTIGQFGRSCAYALTSSSLRAHLMVLRYL